ncbi:MAG TPA: bifunctional methylenetetrahydrofolate dehydrogenase/methenyltetrahydrofolate cyclohydrolase FolD [Clostridia bacterium]|nr:bifunctional methylenetetrahydrofolate dehydrogenase/methenyltetrahydrofolate cyclohydrolase FolD [Clostridia bacterium]
MAAVIINGKEVSAKVKNQITESVRELREQHGVTPGLAVIIVGGNPASRVYVNNKEKDCAETGIHSEEYALDESTSQRDLLQLVDNLNKNPAINGILVQLPLPSHLNEEEVINAISPEKDVDAFHPANVGRIMIGDFDFLPCTPSGIMDMLDDSGIEIAGKECVVVGRSNIVGKPMAMLLLHRNGTVTVCHSRTKNLEEVTRRADILVVAVGKAHFITAGMVKPGAVVIDVGMNRLDNGKLTGDVDFDAVAPIASYITPVPGGVGPMTRATLLKNTLRAAKLQNGI